MSQGNPLYNPFKGNVNDTALLNYNYVLNNTISFNRYSTSWGVDVTDLINHNRSLLTYGTETSEFKEWTIKGRFNFLKSYTFELLQKTGNNDLFTPSFNNRNYEIKIYTTEPRLTYTPSTKFRAQLGYQFVQKNNSEQYGGEKATFNTITTETKYNTFSNTSLTAKFSFSNIDYKGEVNTTVSYIMLDALLPGKNYIWNLSLTKRLINALEINIEYEGRQSGATKAIHLGTVSLRALL